MGFELYWKCGRSQGEQKSLYYFAIFTIINKLLIIKNCHVNPCYRLMQARGKMQSFSDLGCYSRGKLFIIYGNGYSAEQGSTSRKQYGIKFSYYLHSFYAPNTALTSFLGDSVYVYIS